MKKILACTLLAALMALGSAPMAFAGDDDDDDGGKGPRQDNDVAAAIGGNGGNGGLAVGVGICAIQIAVVGDAGCPNNGVAAAGGGNGGDAKAVADEN